MEEPTQTSARQRPTQNPIAGGNENGIASRTVPKNQLQNLIDTTPHNQSLQDFDAQFDQYKQDSHRAQHQSTGDAGMCRAKTKLDPTNYEEPLAEDDLLDDMDEDLGDIKITEMDVG